MSAGSGSALLSSFRFSFATVEELDPFTSWLPFSAGSWLGVDRLDHADPVTADPHLVVGSEPGGVADARPRPGRSARTAGRYWRCRRGTRRRSTISVVIAPTMVGEAASDLTRPRPFIAVLLAIPYRGRSLPEEEVEEVLGRGAARRGPVAAQPRRSCRSCWRPRAAAAADAGQQFLQLLRARPELFWIDAARGLLDLLLLRLPRRYRLMWPAGAAGGACRPQRAAVDVSGPAGSQIARSVGALRTDARVVAARLPTAPSGWPG